MGIVQNFKNYILSFSSESVRIILKMRYADFGDLYAYHTFQRNQLTLQSNFALKGEIDTRA